MVRIVTREQWGARRPKRKHNIPTPTRDLYEHHTVGDYRGAAGIRAIQNFHMDNRGWSDIAYSFVIDRRSHQIYEGRGAGVAGGHTRGQNTTSHAICVTGNFEIHQPTEALLATIAALVRHGHSKGWWPNRITGGHRDAPGANTACPGKYLYLAIPKINRLANFKEPTVNQQHVERIERAVAELGYTVNIDGKLGDREAAAVENMVEGINNLLAKERDLKDVVEQQRKALKKRNRDAELLQAVRQLLKP